MQRQILFAEFQGNLCLDLAIPGDRVWLERITCR